MRFLGTGNPFGVIIATIVGVPMYADIFGCIPIAEALLAKGARLGVVLSFMMGSNHTVSSIHDYAEKGNQTKTLRSVHWNLYRRNYYCWLCI